MVFARVRFTRRVRCSKDIGAQQEKRMDMTTIENVTYAMDARCARCDRTYGAHQGMDCPGQGADSSTFLLAEDSETPQTYLDFFRNLERYTVFSTLGRAGEGEYVFFDWESSDSGEPVAVFHDMTWGDRIAWDTSTLNAPVDSRWVVLKNDGDDPKKLDRFTIRLLNDKRRATSYENELQQRATSAENRCGRVETDFRTLNEKINDYATEQQMCRDYERRISGWNEDLSVMKLVGRKQTWWVPVMIAALSDSPFALQITECHSAEEAKERVEQMNTGAIIRNLTEQGYHFDSISVSFEDVDPPYV